MIRDLRFAIGSCSFKQPSAWRGIGYQYLCDIVEAKLEQLKKLDRAKLIGLPKAQEENAWLDGSWIQIVIDHEKRDDGADLIVVGASRYSLRWPNYFSLYGVGHIVADGILISKAGEISDAPDSIMWAYR